MENVTTTATFVINNSFWQQIPAAAYVLLGVIISGIFAVYTDNKNCKNNKDLKELENKNNRMMQAIEISHKEKLQILKEKGDKSLRLLDDRIKVFTEFHKNFSILRSSGKLEEQLKKTINFRTSLYKLMLLVPDLEVQLNELDDELKNYANYFHACLYENKKDPSDTIRKKQAEIIINKTKEILKQLASQL